MHENQLIREQNGKTKASASSPILTQGHKHGAFTLYPDSATQELMYLEPYHGAEEMSPVVASNCIRIALQIVAQYTGMFVAGRLMIGISIAVQNLIAPKLLGELLGPRGLARVLGLFFSCYCVDSLLPAIVNYGLKNM